MKTNQIYLVVAVVIIIILGFAFWNKSKTDETSDKTVETSTSTAAKTQNTNKPNQTGTPGSVPSIPSTTSLNGSTFRMTTYNGTALPSDSKYTLTFEGGKLDAKICNSMTGNFVLDGSLLKATNLISTKMACTSTISTVNIMKIESDFASILGSGARIYRTGNTIILSHTNGTVMVFAGF